jgi:CHAD domain-containing protein
MQQNTSGSYTGRDTVFMHDYRVSIRKIRSVLKLGNDVLAQDVITKYKKFFSMLGKLTGPVRDIDVFLMQLENYQQDFSETERQRLQALRDYLLLSRSRAQKKYINVLKSSRYRESIEQWRDYLESSAGDLPAENARKAVYKLADELIWNIYLQAIVQGNAIVDNSEAETLHELRKTFKKLRYMMDFFRSIYPAGKMKVLIHALKVIQDNLGKLNDLNVHTDIVKGFIKQSSDESAIQVCEQMITMFEQQRRNTREKFTELYAGFSSSANQNNFREIFIDYHGGQ